MKKLFFVYILLTVHFSQAQTVSSHFNGASSIAGNLKPDGQTFGISLQNEMIHIRALDSSVLYDVLYEFKNTTANYGVVNVMQPITIYFNEFRPGLRAPMIDQLGKLFIDIFKVQDPAIDIRDQIKANFGQSLFVRRYVSTENLKAMGIVADVFRNNQRSSYKKIMIEFRWEDADPYNLNKNTEVLVMEIKFTTDFTFNPNEQFNLLSFLKLPTTVCGVNEKQIYAPYQIGYDQKWEGAIKNIYIQHDIFKATPILPPHYAYSNKYVGERDQVVIIKNITPAKDEKIAFYAIEENYSQCGENKLVEERSIIPVPVKNVTASSWVKTDARIPNQNYVVTNEVAMSDNIQIYQTGNPSDLDMLTQDFQSVPYTSYLLNDYLTGDCKGESADIAVKESGHPIYAFDISNHNDEDPAFAGKENLQMQTCWCEGVPGLGRGEYIEFELTQPVKAIKIYNGNHGTEKIFNESSKVDIIRFSSPDGIIQDMKYSIIDLKIQNLYVLSLPAGRYRIYMDEVDEGKIPVTCISSITFDFDLKDEWYQKSISLLESVYKKPK
ncbi:MAG: hypothetical protein H7X71_01830 [Chitinophagales bacterium]|nr:hypothetical protein [Chitinophagales bacterium]